MLLTLTEIQWLAFRCIKTLDNIGIRKASEFIADEILIIIGYQTIINWFLTINTIKANIGIPGEIAM